MFFYYFIYAITLKGSLLCKMVKSVSWTLEQVCNLLHKKTKTNEHKEGSAHKLYDKREA